MIRNYFKIAWRNVLKNKTFSFINIIGLSVSMSVCLLIIMIIYDQYSFDNYHTHQDRIYRVHTTRDGSFGRENASSALPLAAKLRDDYPIIEKAVGLNKRIGGDLIYNEKFASGGGYFTESDLFKILDFSFKEGDPNTALDEPFSLVITSEMADQLFPSETALGKVIEFHDKGILATGTEEGNLETNYGTFTITGVLYPNPGKTHLPFKFLASLNTMPALKKDKLFFFNENDWADVWTNYTYVLLKEGQGIERLQNALDRVSEEQYKNSTTDKFSFKATRLKKITPSEFIGNTTHISMPKIMLLILTILCLIVMLSACLNYTNLSVAQAFNRIKEVGVRKVSGASKGQIFAQFITESIVISLLSLIFSYGLLLLLQTAFSGLWLNSFLDISFEQNAPIISAFILFSIFIGFVAGVLPALYISSLNPIHLFKKFKGIRLFKKLGVRKALLVIQFSISLIFMISVLLLHSQAKHLLNFDYGFDTEDVVTVKLYNPDNYDRFAQNIKSNPSISHVGATSLLPAGGTNMGAIALHVGNIQDSVQVNYMDINKMAIGAFGLEIIAGQYQAESDNENAILINELAVKNLRFNSNLDAIGKQILVEGQTLQITGVVKDFNFLTPDRPVESLLLRNRVDQFRFAIVKIKGKYPSDIVSALESSWKKVNPNTKFVYSFLDDELLFIHTLLKDVLYVIGLLSFLAILVSCLGLLGMAAYTAKTRFKEIGIRKTLGSSVPEIIFLLSKSFIGLLAIAILISAPLAYFINTTWLAFFASHVNVHISHIILGVLSVLILSFIMIFSQSYRAATASPVKSLHTE